MSKKKKITCVVKLQVSAGKANPAPPIGTALGPRGINIMEFCKSFNEKTKGMEVGMPIPVVITVFSDKSFSFEMKSPPNTYYIKKYLGISKGHTSPGKGEVLGKLNMSQIKEIAEQKIKDTNANDLDGAMSMIMGSARSMGVEVGDS